MAISCDPSSLANAARCFGSCVPAGAQEAVKSYLLCQYSNSASGSGSHILTEGGDNIATENGDLFVTE